MNTLTIFTTGPGCHKCSLTKKMFDDKGIEYNEIRLDDPVNESIVTDLMASGHGVAPVVTDQLTQDTWSDFRRDKIKASIKARQ